MSGHSGRSAETMKIQSGQGQSFLHFDIGPHQQVVCTGIQTLDLPYVSHLLGAPHMIK